MARLSRFFLLNFLLLSTLIFVMRKFFCKRKEKDGGLMMVLIMMMMIISNFFLFCFNYFIYYYIIHQKNKKKNIKIRPLFWPIMMIVCVGEFDLFFPEIITKQKKMKKKNADVCLFYIFFFQCHNLVIRLTILMMKFFFLEKITNFFKNEKKTKKKFVRHTYLLTIRIFCIVFFCFVFKTQKR